MTPKTTTIVCLFTLTACGSRATTRSDAGHDAASGTSVDAAVAVDAASQDAAPATLSDAAPADASPDAALVPCQLPVLDSAWRTVATMPDVGDLASPSQQVVDFSIWQDAADRWQVLSCIRGTKEPGNGRVLHRWEAETFEQAAWTARGIAMHADPQLGETAGGLQAPFVFRNAGAFRMLYGDWEHIDSATSPDGVTFARLLDANGHPQLFDEGPGNNTRDPMVLRVGDHWNVYYTAFPSQRGADYVRTSTDLVHWSESKLIAVGGMAGAGPLSAECPFVHYEPKADRYYLFRTQIYGQNAQTTVYCSPDPTDFGVDDDRYRMGTLPVAAPEIFEYQGETWMAATTPDLQGIRVTRIHFTP